MPVRPSRSPLPLHHSPRPRKTKRIRLILVIPGLRGVLHGTKSTRKPPPKRVPLSRFPLNTFLLSKPPPSKTPPPPRPAPVPPQPKSWSSPNP